MPLQAYICRPRRQYNIINLSRRKSRGQQAGTYIELYIQTLALFVGALAMSKGAVRKGYSSWMQHEQQRAAFLQTLTDRNDSGPWSLVKQTLTHSGFSQHSSFGSNDNQCQHRKSLGLDIDSEPTLLSIDCEMCITERAVRQLIGLCIVNSAGSTVLKMLVKPGGVVLDWRTPVTGATWETMQGVTYTWKDAQQAVQLLLKGNVMLVGHALHNDLKAVHLDPTAFIDTALLFSYKDFPRRAPSLTELVRQVLGQSLRQDGAIHDCEQYATATMQLVNHALQHGIQTDLQAPPIKVPQSDPRFVYVRSVPAHMKSSDLLELFADCNCVPLDFRRKLERGKGHVEFANAGDAAEAFKQLPAVQEVDGLGREKKLVPLRAGQCKDSMIQFWKFPLLAG